MPWAASLDSRGFGLAYLIQILFEIKFNKIQLKMIVKIIPILKMIWGTGCTHTFIILNIQENDWKWFPAFLEWIGMSQLISVYDPNCSLLRSGKLSIEEY